VIVGELQAESPIRDHVVERRHHLGLAHRRHTRKVCELEAVRVDSAEPAGMKRRMLEGVAQ